ncbi:MAG: methyltransferase domain-containing protein [Spartobacteria bacterium]|nr:methyltransferase domain-containing protein [Spartobacteria bacterium]
MSNKKSTNKEEAVNSYDTLPYPPYSFPATHIGRLGAIGRVFGLTTVDPSKARVLELGCGVGVNIMAMAQLFSEAEFVGIDSSKKQIDAGLKAVKVTGLKNVRLIEADFSKLDEDLGKFDYIIVHGIYSWVPDSVKEAILRIGSKNLNPGGVTYVSYNCLPGWRMRGALRDMMIMHTSGIPDVLAKVAQSKALLKFLAESCAQETPYGKYLAQELDLISKCDDSYIAHDFLETENDALYFTDFLKAAAKHDLNYLGDAEPSTMVTDNLPAEAAKTLKSLNLNLLATEQYIDFVRNRMFRSTLLCHKDAQLNRNIDPSRLESLNISSLIMLKQAYKDGQPAIFVGAGGVELSIAEPATATIFEMIAKQGKTSLSVEELLKESIPLVSKILKATDEAAIKSLISQILLQGYFKKMLDFTLGALSTCTTKSENPQSLPLARLQVSEGLRVSSNRLEMLNADPYVAKLLTLCDGARDKKTLIAAMVESLDKKEYQLNENNQPITDAKRAKLVVEKLYDGSIQNLTQLGLLVSKAS